MGLGFRTVLSTSTAPVCSRCVAMSFSTTITESCAFCAIPRYMSCPQTLRFSFCYRSDGAQDGELGQKEAGAKWRDSKPSRSCREGLVSCGMDGRIGQGIHAQTSQSVQTCMLAASPDLLSRPRAWDPARLAVLTLKLYLLSLRARVSWPFSSCDCTMRPRLD